MLMSKVRFSIAGAARMARRGAIALTLPALLLTACDRGHPESKASYGPNPVLPDPDKSIVPTVNFSTAIPWPASAKPTAPAGFTVSRYATGLGHPGWIY